MATPVAALMLAAADGYLLRGSVWRHPPEPPAGRRNGTPPRAVVIINAATSVRCRYYARFAAYLHRNGLDVITYDYRGIGESRPARLRGFAATWVDWGRLDFEAALTYATTEFAGQPIDVVAHSIGGFLIGFAPSSHRIRRIFTMGAQFAYWRDFEFGARVRMLARWYLLMPTLGSLLGYFPASRLGWMEDTPLGVVRNWSRARARFEDGALERGASAADKAALVQHFAGVRAPLLALSVSDDDFGTVPAIERVLAYFPNSPAVHLRVDPEHIAQPAIGHFAYFHARFEDTLWPIALAWVKCGELASGMPGRIVSDRRGNTAPAAPTPWR